MTAQGRITSTTATPGTRLRVQPITYGAPEDARPSFVPARNLRDSVPSTVLTVERVAPQRRGYRAQSRILITVRTDDGRELAGHFAPAETQRLA